MTDDRIEELLSGAADQQLDADEQSELTTLLATESTATDIARRYRDLETLLESIPDAEPPSDLRDRIMRSAPFVHKPVQGAKSAGFFPAAANALLRYGFSAAFGALLVLAVYESQPQINQSVDITDLVGTMAPESGAGRSRLIDAYSISEDGVSSSARLEERRGFVVLDIRVDTARTVGIAIDLSAAGLGMEALSQRPGTLESIRFADNVLQVETRGQRQFSVLLHGDSTGNTATGVSTVTLVYTSNGTVVGQGSLRY